MTRLLTPLDFFVLTAGCWCSLHFDLVLQNGIVYDGSGGEPFLEDIGISTDTIAAIGDLKHADVDIFDLAKIQDHASYEKPSSTLPGFARP